MCLDCVRYLHLCACTVQLLLRPCLGVLYARDRKLHSDSCNAEETTSHCWILPMDECLKRASGDCLCALRHSENDSCLRPLPFGCCARWAGETRHPGAVLLIRFTVLSLFSRFVTCPLPPPPLPHHPPFFFFTWSVM